MFLSSRSRNRSSIDLVVRKTLETLETLEPRTMMSVTLDSSGFTTVTPESDSRLVYVSSSGGSDSNNGLSPDAPVRSLAKSESLVRNGSPDQLLLKRGDVWNESFGGFAKSGRGMDEPLVIGTYGSGDRPWIKTGSRNGITTNGAKSNGLVIQGLHFEANTRNPDSDDFTGDVSGGYGIQIVGSSDSSGGVLIEDVLVDHYQNNVSISGYNGTLRNVTVRRSVITDSYSTPSLSTGGKSQGLYAAAVDGLTIQGNVFDHNGWNEKISAAVSNIYSHNIYLWANNKNVAVKENVISDAGSHGLQARAGGTITDNLFLNNPIGMVLGEGSSVTPGGVTGLVDGNVFLSSRDINGAGRGWAIEAGNIKSATISDNLIADDNQLKNAAIKLDRPVNADNPQDVVGINNLTIKNNTVYKWYQGISINGSLVDGSAGPTSLSNLTVKDNDFQAGTSTKVITHANAFNDAEEDWAGNRYANNASTGGWFSIGGSTTSLDSWKNKVEPTASNNKVDYPDPTRTAATYNASVGGSSSTDAFLAQERRQAKNNWRKQYAATAAIAYIRAGFGLDGIVPNGIDNGGGSNDAPTVSEFVANDVTTAGTSPETIKVTFADDSAVLTSSFGSGDIKVSGPNGIQQTATFVKADNTTNGTPRTATYTIAAPGGSWDASDNGTYTVSLASNGVRDVAGAYAAAGTIGSFKVAIPVTPTDADSDIPVVLGSKYDASNQAVSIQFSKDVSRSLHIGDIRIRDDRTQTMISASNESVSWDASSNTATWKVLTPLTEQSYRAVLVTSGVYDANGTCVDGDGNGIAGGDYAVKFTNANYSATVTAIAPVTSAVSEIP